MPVLTTFEVEQPQFEESIIKLIPQFESYGRQYNNSIFDLNDLVQETLYKAIINQKKYDQKKDLLNWLKSIMKNTYINQYNRKKLFIVIDTIDTYYGQ